MEEDIPRPPYKAPASGLRDKVLQWINLNDSFRH